MRKFHLVFAILAIGAAAPASAQLDPRFLPQGLQPGTDSQNDGPIDPGYNVWVERGGYVFDPAGDTVVYDAYRVNGDGTTTYRTTDGKEITFDAAESDQVGGG
jgi:hypothetical protein